MRARAFIPSPNAGATVGLASGGRVTVEGREVGTITALTPVEGGFEVDLNVDDPDVIAALSPPIRPEQFSYREEDPNAPHH